MQTVLVRPKRVVILRCPNCTSVMPLGLVQRPDDVEVMTFVCRACGAEVDKPADDGLFLAMQ